MHGTGTSDDLAWRPVCFRLDDSPPKVDVLNDDSVLLTQDMENLPLLTRLRTLDDLYEVPGDDIPSLHIYFGLVLGGSLEQLLPQPPAPSRE